MLYRLAVLTATYDGTETPTDARVFAPLVRCAGQELIFSALSVVRKHSIIAMIFVFSVFTMAAEPLAYLYSCELHLLPIRTKAVATAYTTLVGSLLLPPYRSQS